jgi:hypothetical protein
MSVLTGATGQQTTIALVMVYKTSLHVHMISYTPDCATGCVDAYRGVGITCCLELQAFRLAEHRP